MLRTSAIAVLTFSLSGLPAFADNRSAETRRTSWSPVSTVRIEWPGQIDRAVPVPFERPKTRPGSLAAMYVSLAALQAYDAYSTTQGVARGAQELNPLLRGAANQPAAFWALKAGTTVLPMLAAERMWKKNRVGAVVVMAVANALAVAVAANNARVLGRQK